MDAMNQSWWLTRAAALALLVLAGCGDLSRKTSDVYREDLRTPDGQPAYVTVQHCLIAFEGTLPKSILRTREEAQQLAEEVLAQAQADEDFSKLVAAHSDDSPPGVYRIANEGFPGDSTNRIMSKQIVPRRSMVTGFGDVSFQLKVGEVGMVPYDPATSRYGWHIVKRIK